MPSIKGTASVSDLRARRKALKGTRFPDNFSQAVELEKLNKQVLTQWIENRVTSILGFEDEIVSSMASNLFLPEAGESPDPKRAQLDLVGFLGEEESASFARDLWTLMLEAQESATGIPKTLLEEKKKELAAKKAESGPAPRDLSMNRYVQEVNRRANAARGAMGGNHGRRHSEPPVSVSPPRYERQSSENRNCRRYHHHADDRRMPPLHRHPDNPSFPGNLHPGRQNGDGPRMPPGPPYGFDRRHERRRSRSFSPDRDRDRTRWGREAERKVDDGGRRNERPRFYDEEDEMRFLERRIFSLRREYSSRPHVHALGDEIDDINDRLHELDRRIRRHRRARDEDDYRRRGGRNSPPHRSRSRTPEIRRHRSRSRSSSSESRSRRRRRSRSRSSESKRSRSSASRSSGSHFRERGRGRAGRQYSSESRSSPRHSDDESRSGRERD